MRNNNPDIVIHSLIDRAINKSESGNKKFDFSEEMMLEEKRKTKLQLLQDRQRRQERLGVWIWVEFEGEKFKILVKRGQSTFEVERKFLQKMSRRK